MLAVDPRPGPAVSAQRAERGETLPLLGQQLAAMAPRPGAQVAAGWRRVDRRAARRPRSRPRRSPSSGRDRLGRRRRRAPRRAARPGCSRSGPGPARPVGEPDGAAQRQLAQLRRRRREPPRTAAARRGTGRGRRNARSRSSPARTSSAAASPGCGSGRRSPAARPIISAISTSSHQASGSSLEPVDQRPEPRARWRRCRRWCRPRR